MADVTVFDPRASAPRSTMQLCSASITTPTPFGVSALCSQLAIWVVSRSCI